MGDRAGFIADLTRAMTAARRETGEWAKRNQLLKTAQDNVTTAVVAHGAGLKAALRAYDAQKKILSDVEKEIAKINKKYQEQTGILGNVNKSLQTLNSSINATRGTFLKFTAALGVGGFTFLELAKVGMQYNRSLFEMSRIQQVAGKSGEDLNLVMGYVSKNTNLSKIQFADFAKTIQSGFLGIKPSLTEIADLSALLANQVGPSFEAQKEAAAKLISIQSKFPQLYGQIVGGMKQIAAMKGGGTEGENAKIAALRERILVTMQLTGATQEEKDTMLKTLTPVTSAQRELLNLEKESQAVAKAMDDAKIKFFNTLQGLFTKAAPMATELLNIFKEYPKTMIGIAVAIPLFSNIAQRIKASEAAMQGLNATMKKNLIFLGLTLAAAGVTYLISRYEKQKKAQEEANKESELSIKINQDVNKLTGDQKTKYNELMKAESENIKTTEDRAMVHQKVMVEIEKEKVKSQDLWYQLDQVRQNISVQLSLVQKLTASYQAQSDAVEQFGGVSQEALQGIVESSAKGAQKAGELVKKNIEAFLTSFSQSGIEIPITADMDLTSQITAIESQVGKYKELNKQKAESAEIDAKMVALRDSATDYIGREAAVTKALISMDSARVRQQENSTSVFEARLDTERKLMESAQFGMGASISMMQKQVDLAYVMMQTYAKQDKQMENRIMSNGKVSRQQMDQIKNAKTMEQAEAIIAKLDKNQRQYALNYARQHQELTKKSMDQQLKIYELTKEIREGYLDAIRSMSTGVGEFQKIIGTHEMGVTQLMDVVNKFTRGALNTMALGGKQSKLLTQMGMGADVTGEYSLSGGFTSGLSAEMLTAMAKRAYGNTARTIGKVGTGMASTEENIGAMQEMGLDKEDMKDSVTNPVVAAINGIGPSVAKNISPALGGLNLGTNESNNTNIGWGVNALRESQGAAGRAPAQPSSEGIPMPSRNNFGFGAFKNFGEKMMEEFGYTPMVPLAEPLEPPEPTEEELRNQNEAYNDSIKGMDENKKQQQNLTKKLKAVNDARKEYFAAREEQRNLENNRGIYEEHVEPLVAARISREKKNIQARLENLTKKMHSAENDLSSLGVSEKKALKTGMSDEKLSNILRDRELKEWEEKKIKGPEGPEGPRHTGIFKNGVEWMRDEEEKGIFDVNGKKIQTKTKKPGGTGIFDAQGEEQQRRDQGPAGSIRYSLSENKSPKTTAEWKQEERQQQRLDKTMEDITKETEMQRDKEEIKRNKDAEYKKALKTTLIRLAEQDQVERQQRGKRIETENPWENHIPYKNQIEEQSVGGLSGMGNRGGLMGIGGPQESPNASPTTPTALIGMTPEAQQFFRLMVGERAAC